MPPSSSSDGGARAPEPISSTGLEQEPGIGLRALSGRLAEEFGVDSRALARVAAVFNDVREQAPDLFVQAAGALDSAFTRARTPGSAEIEQAMEVLCCCVKLASLEKHS